MIYFVIIFGGPLWYSTESTNNPHFDRYIEHFNKWLAKNPDGELRREGRFPRHPVFYNLKPSAMKLTYRMMHLDPAKRITIKEALEDPWVQQIEICNVDDELMRGDSEVDAGSKTAIRQASKAGIRRLHHHLPPKANGQSPFGREYGDE